MFASSAVDRELGVGVGLGARVIYLRFYLHV